MEKNKIKCGYLNLHKLFKIRMREGEGWEKSLHF